MSEKKIQTRFPDLHKAHGASDAELEVLPAPEKKEGDDQAAAEAAQQQNNQQQQQQQGNSGGVQNNGGNDQQQQQQAAAAQQQQQSGGANDQQQQQQQQGKKSYSLDDLKDMDEETRNEFLSTLTGGKIKSVEELTPAKQKSPEELAEEAANLKRDSLAWALENNLVKQEDYDNAVILKSKTDRELALSAFAETVRAENKDITGPEIEELFKDTYHEGQKEDSLLFKQGQRQIKQLADTMRESKVGILDKIEPEYQQVLQTQQQYKGFKKQVKEVMGTLPKSFEFSFDHPNADGTPNTFKLDVPVDQKVIDKVIGEMTSERSFSIRNLEANGKFDDKKISEELTYHLKARMFDDAIKAALQQNARDVEKHTLVQLGNKRQEGAQLNNGQQQFNSGSQQQNNYDDLHKFHKTGKYRSASGVN